MPTRHGLRKRAMTMKKPRNDANQNAYRQWLVKRSGAFMYEYLFEYLFEMPFESPIRRDKNRAEDGKYLRFIYQTDTNRNPGLSRNNDQCSVLEFLIALADATNEMTEYTQSTRYWLQMFLDNTDLARYNDNFWTDGHENETVPIWQEPILQEVGSRVNGCCKGTTIGMAQAVDSSIFATRESTWRKSNIGNSCSTGHWNIRFLTNDERRSQWTK